MGKLQMIGQANAVAGARAAGGGAPLADAVECQNGRLGKGAGEEGAGGVALMVIEEDNRAAQPLAQAAADRAP